MKPKTSVLKPLAVIVAVVGLSAILISWNYMPSGFRFAGNNDYSDTVPPKKNKTDRDKKVRDLDEAIEELENVEFKIDMEKIKKEIEQAMKSVDMEKIKLEVENAMKEVDMKKIKLEVENALKEVDMKKIQAELNESLAKIDGEKIKLEIENAMKEVDMEKIKKEIEESMSKIDMNKIKAEINMDKMKDLEIELKKIGPEIEKSLEKAKVEIEKAKVELKEYKTFIDGLEKDGLINKKEGYKLEHKNGELFINGKKQPDNVYNKYKSFLEKHKSIKIGSDEDDFNIDID